MEDTLVQVAILSVVLVACFVFLGWLIVRRLENLGRQTVIHTSGEAVETGIIRRKVKPNVLYLATLLTSIELVLSVFLFVLIMRILRLASEIDNVQGLDVGLNLELLLTSAGIAALFSAWMIVMGTIVGALASTMAQVAEEKPDKEPPSIPVETYERREDALLQTLKSSQ